MIYRVFLLLPLEANGDDLRVHADTLDIDDTGSGNQIGEPGEAEIARIEVRRLFRQMRTHAGEISAAIFFSRGGHCFGEHIKRSAIQR